MNQVSGQEHGSEGGKWREGEIVDKASSGGASNVRSPLTFLSPTLLCEMFNFFDFSLFTYEIESRRSFSFSQLSRQY